MTGKTEFEEHYSFRRDEVRLGNWRTAPYSRWSFQNVGELVPTARVFAGSGVPEEPAVEIDALLREKVALPGGTETIADMLARTHADALTIMRAGAFIGDWSAPTMGFGEPHIIFSITKSLTAIIAGALQDEGLLDAQAPVTRYVPEAAPSVYGDASVQHVLDMTVAIDIEEAYLDPQSPFARYRRAMLWNPGGGDEGLSEFLCTIPRLPSPHGEVFRYRSPNTDMLGIILERAANRRYSDLLRDKLFAPLGARSPITVTVDREGTSRASAGVSLTARDLARVGEMMRQGGVANGRRIVSSEWVRDTVTGGSRDAWLRSDFTGLFANGQYRNKWYQSGDGSFYGIGIHGQWLFVHPSSETVIVKMSSQPEPVTDALDMDNIAFLNALVTMV